MAYRFTNTEKWNDSWFSELRLSQKALFLYLCDQCDIAGFLEINIRKISFDLGIGKQEVEGALKGLDRSFIYSQDKKTIFLKNFIRHQKNLPLNNNNKAHRGIIKRLEENIQRFGYEDVNQFLDSTFKGASKPLERGTGIGNGNNIDNSEEEKGGVGEKEETILNEFEKFRKVYPGTKRGLKTEFENFKKKHKDYKEAVFLLLPAIEEYIMWREKKTGLGQFVPEYTIMQTWINQRRWESELEKLDQYGTVEENRNVRRNSSAVSAADKTSSRKSLKNIASKVLEQYKS